MLLKNLRLIIKKNGGRNNQGSISVRGKKKKTKKFSLQGESLPKDF